jgi:hypothetical protein
VESLEWHRITKVARDDSESERSFIWHGSACLFWWLGVIVATQSHSSGLGATDTAKSHSTVRGYSGGTNSLRRRVVKMTWGHSKGLSSFRRLGNTQLVLHFFCLCLLWRFKVTLVARGHFSSIGSHWRWRCEVTSVAHGYS